MRSLRLRARRRSAAGLGAGDSDAPDSDAPDSDALRSESRRGAPRSQRLPVDRVDGPIRQAALEPDFLRDAARPLLAPSAAVGLAPDLLWSVATCGPAALGAGAPPTMPDPTTRADPW